MVFTIFFLLVISYIGCYIALIIHTKSELNSISNLINKIEVFYHRGDDLSDELIAESSSIFSELNLYLPEPISYLDTNEEIIENFKIGYSHLKDLEGMYKIKLKEDMKISTAFKKFISLPGIFMAHILKAIGITLSFSIKCWLSIFTWLATFILGLFQTEIHNWIMDILKQWFD